MDTTRADAFLNDDRITQARALLLETMAEHQRSITGVQPADPALQSSYSALLAELAEHRGARTLFP